MTLYVLRKIPSRQMAYLDLTKRNLTRIVVSVHVKIITINPILNSPIKTPETYEIRIIF